MTLRRLEIDEGRDIAKYGKQLKALGDEPSIAILEEVIADEREHYVTLGNLIRSRGALPSLPPEQARVALMTLLRHVTKDTHKPLAGLATLFIGSMDGPVPSLASSPGCPERLWAIVTLS